MRADRLVGVWVGAALLAGACGSDDDKLFRDKVACEVLNTAIRAEVSQRATAAYAIDALKSEASDTSVRVASSACTSMRKAQDVIAIAQHPVVSEGTPRNSFVTEYERAAEAFEALDEVCELISGTPAEVSEAVQPLMERFDAPTKWLVKMKQSCEGWTPIGE